MGKSTTKINCGCGCFVATLLILIALGMIGAKLDTIIELLQK